MNKDTVFSLNRKTILTAMIAAAFPVIGHAAAGRVEFAIGNVNAITSDGRSRPLTKGGEINPGETIQTIDGRAQIRFSDDGYISLQPNTEFKVEDYNFNGKADGTEKGFFSLVKGGLRAITGAIGHTNRTAYRVNTPVATIGIRGTEYTLVQAGDKWLVKVGAGSVFLENQGGNLILFKGQGAEINGQGSKPQYTDIVPSVTAAAPQGNDPQKNQDEQNSQTQQNTVFTVNEQYNDSGQSTAVANDVTTAAIQQYHAANAIGYYDLVNDASNHATDSNGGIYKATSGSITAYFGSYAVSANLFVVDTSSFSSFGSGSSGFSSGFYTKTANLFASGSILTNTPAFGLSGGGYGNLCSASCSFSAVGLFQGPTAQQASIGYTIGNTLGGHNITGGANFNAPAVPGKPQ